MKVGKCVVQESQCITIATVPLKCKLPPSRATRIASRATKKKLQVQYVGLLHDLNWPFVITFEREEHNL